MKLPKIKIGRFLGKVAKTAAKAVPGGSVAVGAVEDILEGRRKVQITAKTTSKVVNTSTAPPTPQTPALSGGGMLPILLGLGAVLLFMRE